MNEGFEPLRSWKDPPPRPAGRGRKLAVLVLFLGLVTLVAAFGGLFAPGEWYAGLEKPPWTPPSAVFGPVWTALHITVALAGWLVWLRRGVKRPAGPVRAAFVFYGLQLALSALWSLFFCGLHRPGLAFVAIVALWFAVIVNILLFYGLRPAAGLLLLPYFAWISFAARLNLALWRLNA